MTDDDIDPKVGLALSGGVAKVVGHVGVLKALAEASVPVHAIAATSGGAIVGAFHAAGVSMPELESLARDVTWKRLTSVTLPRLGLLSNEKIEKLVTDRLGDIRFEDLEIPLAVVGANLTTGKKAVFTKGRLGPAIRASCSVPQLFTPVSIDGSLIADGGLVEYLPVQTLDTMGCHLKFGVNLGGVRDWHKKDPKNFIELALRVIGFVSQQNALVSEAFADHVVRPNLSDVGAYDLDRADEVMHICYEATRADVPRLRQLLAEKTAETAPPDGGDWSRIIRWFRRHTPIPGAGRKAS